MLAIAARNATQGAHGAGNDDHAVGLERSRRDRGAHVAGAVHHAGEAPHLLHAMAGLVFERTLRPLADDQMAFDLGRLERLQHSPAENGAGRPGHADDETPHLQFSAAPAVGTTHERPPACKRGSPETLSTRAQQMPELLLHDAALSLLDFGQPAYASLHKSSRPHPAGF